MKTKLTLTLLTLTLLTTGCEPKQSLTPQEAALLMHSAADVGYSCARAGITPAQMHQKIDQQLHAVNR